MSRPNLNPTMAAALDDGLIVPAMLAELTLKSGVVRVWSGVGDLVWDSKTWSGIGLLGSVGAITEASAVQAEGTTVTLSGIGLSQFDIPALGVTPPDPPFAPPAGQSVAWSLATEHSGEVNFPGTGPAYFISGNASSTLTSGELGLMNGGPISDNSIAQGWFNFQMPPEIPPGATIRGVYPYAFVEPPSPPQIIGGFTRFSGSGWTLNAVVGANVGPNIGTLSSIEAAITNSVPNKVADPSTDVLLVLGISFIGFAVYYEGEPLTKTSMLYEAMNDIRLGGPAKIWFGLMAEGTGTFLGAPYLVFSGSVDKPTVKPSPNGSTIELALENRMVNLQRASNRKYTAADQHLFFPDDLFFNWVEILQDISLKEGQA